MGDLRRRKCKRCGKPDRLTGELSWTGLCTACAEDKKLENNEGIRNLTGAPFRHWRRQTAAAVGGVLLDDLPEPLAREVIAHLTAATQAPTVEAA